jgi:hypothetical protein
VLTPVDTDAMPLEAEVESDETLLLVVERPVDREVSRLTALLRPDEVDVESDETLLFVVDRPVESELTPL